jgi:hypothetical protein
MVDSSGCENCIFIGAEGVVDNYHSEATGLVPLSLAEMKADAQHTDTYKGNKSGKDHPDSAFVWINS